MLFEDFVQFGYQFHQLLRVMLFTSCFRQFSPVPRCKVVRHSPPSLSRTRVLPLAGEGSLQLDYQGDKFRVLSQICECRPGCVRKSIRPIGNSCLQFLPSPDTHFLRNSRISPSTKAQHTPIANEQHSTEQHDRTAASASLTRPVDVPQV